MAAASGRRVLPGLTHDRAQAIAAIERITRGIFRLLGRLSPQIARVLKINGLESITDDVIEAAASVLVIGNNATQRSQNAATERSSPHWWLGLGRVPVLMVDFYVSCRPGLGLCGTLTGCLSIKDSPVRPSGTASGRCCRTW